MSTELVVAALALRLLHACSAGNTAAAQVLLAAGAVVDHAADNTGATPLYVASWAGHLETVRALLAAGAAVDQARTDTGATPLFNASLRGHLETAQDHPVPPYNQPLTPGD